MPIVLIGENTGDTYAGAEDTFLDSAQPTTNLSGAGDLSIGKYDVGQHANGVMKFTGLSNISGPVTVNEVRLYGSIEFVGASAGHTIQAFRLLRNVNVSQATWNTYSTGNNWGTAGGLSNGVDRVGTASGQIVLATGSESGYIQLTGSGLATDVANWINGVNANYGWLLERTDGQDDNEFFAFTSSEGSDTARPYLYVDYEVGAGSSPLLKIMRRYL